MTLVPLVQLLRIELVSYYLIKRVLFRSAFRFGCRTFFPEEYNTVLAE